MNGHPCRCLMLATFGCPCLHCITSIHLQKLEEYSLSELEGLWFQATTYSLQRQTWMKDLDRRLAEIEQERMNKVSITALFSGLRKNMILLPVDCVRSHVYFQHVLFFSRSVRPFIPTHASWRTLLISWLLI